MASTEQLVQRHHSIYPQLPPQGLFFEALVQQAFRLAGWAAKDLIPSTPNSPWHDLLVGTVRLSIKSETGKATRRAKISITKLCTTETGDWTATALVDHALRHIRRYDQMLMLRAIWCEKRFDYQLVEIPLDLLKRMANAQFSPVGVRPGRKSIAGHVLEEGETLFRVHFDGADGKCQVQGLLIERCRILREWPQQFPSAE